MKPALTTAPQGGGSLRLDDQLCFALHSTMLALGKVYRHLLAELDVTYPQYLVLMVLWESDGLLVNQIGERLGLDSATLTPLLKRLAARELVTRTRDPDDERCVAVTLTAKGRQLKRRALAVPRALQCHLGLPLDELHGLKAGLEQLREHLRQGM